MGWIKRFPPAVADPQEKKGALSRRTLSSWFRPKDLAPQPLLTSEPSGSTPGLHLAQREGIARLRRHGCQQRPN